MKCEACNAPVPQGYNFCDNVCREMLQQAQEEINNSSEILLLFAELIEARDNPVMSWKQKHLSVHGVELRLKPLSLSADDRHAAISAGEGIEGVLSNETSLIETSSSEKTCFV